MTWNHRVMRRQYPNAAEVLYEIHVVYYDEKDVPYGHTTDPIDPSGTTLGNLREVLAMMTRALDAPVLDYETGQEWKGVVE